MVRHKPTKAIPTLNSTHRQVSDYFTKLEFYKLFAEHMVVLTQKYYGASYAKRLVKTLENNKVEIVNMAHFLAQRLLYMGDVGTYAYMKEKELMPYVRTVIATLKRFEQGGLDTIDVTSVFFYMAEIKNRTREKKELVEACIHMLAGAMYYPIDTFDKNPYVLRIFLQKEAVIVAEKLGLTNIAGYTGLVGVYLGALNKVRNTQNTKSCSAPAISMCSLIKYDARTNQINRLVAIYGLDRFKVTNAVAHIPNLSEESEELIKVLDEFKKVKGYDSINSRAVIDELKHIEDEGNMCALPDSVSYYFYRNFQEYFGLPRMYVRGLGITEEYLEKESFLRSFTITFNSINIDCSKIETPEDLEVYVHAAADLLAITRRRAKENKALKMDHLVLAINLQNVKDISTKFVNDAKELEKAVCSKHNKNFVITISYESNVATSKSAIQAPKYLRVISDIHADVNAKMDYMFNFGTDYVLNCGDTAGSAFKERDWIRTYMRRGVVIPGNHLGYDKPWLNLDKNGEPSEFGTIENPDNAKNRQTDYLRVHFSSSKTLHYLSNDIVSADFAYIIGTQLYTDFKLFGEKNKVACMMEGQRGLNDFRYCTHYDKNSDTVVPFTAEEHAKLFRVCWGYISNKLKYIERNRKRGDRKPIILVTHHAPTPYSISEEYKNDPLSACFASDLRWFIDEHPEIRLWCHGHCVDDQTEVLTIDGWKTFNEIKQSDILLNLNTKTGEIEQDYINAIISNNYSGKVYHFKPKGSDIRVTAEHDMLLFNKENGKLQKMSAEKVYARKQKVIVRAAQQNKEGLNLTDDLLRLLVWISADGNRPNSNSNLIRFYLHKKRKIERLKKLLDSLGTDYKEFYRSKTDSYCIHFYLPDELRDYSFKPVDKRITLCNRHQCGVVIEEYSHTDGNKNGNTIIIYTSKKEEADAIQLMCITNGYGCAISPRVNHGFQLKSTKEKISYDLHIVDNPYRCIDNPPRTTTIEEVKNEHFWCLNTNNGTLIIRRNGKVNITGNCHTPVDYIYKNCRVVAEPFGYYWENDNEYKDKEDIKNYGLRIPIKGLTNKMDWREVLKQEIERGMVKVYDN